MGSGWGALVWDPVAQRLATTQIHDHQSEVTQGGVPILVLDAWEHAYYLQYKTEKAKYFEAVWNLWNWRDVEARFSLVQKVDLGLVAAVNGAPVVAH
jgi:Fe-Mn family superoxide dismutase